MDEDLKSASDGVAGIEHKPSYSPKHSDKKHKSKKAPLLIFLLILVLAGVGFAAWKFVLNKPKPAPTPAATAPVATKPKIAADTPNEPLSQKYESTKLSVAFQYPIGWKVTESGGGIRVESPNFTFNAIGAGDISGNFRVYIRQGARDIDAKYIGHGVAIKPSEKLTYTQPASGQRSDTLLQIFGLNDSDNFGFFLIAGNFNLVKNDTLGPAYGKEPDTYIVTGGYTTPAALDDLATMSVEIDYYSTTNAYKQAQAILASLQLQ